MHLDPHLDDVTKHLMAAAALGDERTRQIAQTLAGAAGPAVRLALLAALTEAAEEISATLVELPGAPQVTVRLDNGVGTDAVVDVHLAETTATGPDDTRDRDAGAEASARISLRLSEALKADIESAAAGAGVSVNAWLVRAATSALNPNPFESLAAFGKNFGSFAPPGGTARGGGKRGGQHVTGWING